MKSIKKAIEKETGITKDNNKGRWQKDDLEVVKIVYKGKVIEIPKK